ncbi:MAG: putative 3-phenylpropionic acid transporter [Devosia sp.]|nr:putative 3-phenylpropionic acid transporter [Devosia sp.]
MTTAATARGISPELRAGIFHFAVYSSQGTVSVYLAIWLAQRGISAEEIGFINALPVLVLFGINMLVGRIADRAGDWRSVIIVLALLAGIAPIALYFVSGFWSILAVWTLCVVPKMSLVPVIDAATVRMTQRNGSDFGIVRAWGTIGYMVSSIVSGFIIGMYGDAAFVPVFLGMSIFRALLSLQLPRFRAPPGAHIAPSLSKQASHLREVLRPWFILPLVGFGMLYATHSILGAFAALLWKQQGISEGMIGPLIATAAAAEAAMMFFWTRLGWQLSARHLLILAMAVAAARWTAMAFNPPLAVLFGLQLLHAFTFALGYFGSIQFIANWTSEDIAAEAQGFAYMLQQGMTVIALIAVGPLVTQFGPGAWLFSTGLSLVGIALVMASLRLQPRHAH